MIVILLVDNVGKMNYNPIRGPSGGGESWFVFIASAFAYENAITQQPLANAIQGRRGKRM